MKRLVYGVLSSLVILSVAAPVKAESSINQGSSIKAESSTFLVAQVDLNAVEEMFRQQRLLTEDIQAMTAEMKKMMAEMKATSALPAGKTATTSDLYKQQQVMIAEMKDLMAEMKKMLAVYRGRVTRTLA